MNKRKRQRTPGPRGKRREHAHAPRVSRPGPRHGREGGHGDRARAGATRHGVRAGRGRHPSSGGDGAAGGREAAGIEPRGAQLGVAGRHFVRLQSLRRCGAVREGCALPRHCAWQRWGSLGVFAIRVWEGVRVPRGSLNGGQRVASAGECGGFVVVCVRFAVRVRLDDDCGGAGRRRRAVCVFWRGSNFCTGSWGCRLPWMVLSVPEAMAELEDVRKGSLDEESSAPESWEMVDLEENMKKLLASSQVATSQVSVEPCIANESNGVSTGLLPFRTDSLDAARGPDHVDGFLKEALQNPRDRLTSKALVSSWLLRFVLGAVGFGYLGVRSMAFSSVLVDAYILLLERSYE